MTGLEALKIVEKDCEDLEQVPYGEFALIEKSLKALEIIKEKRVDIESFYTSFIEGEYDYDFYERRYGTYGKYCLTEEEFNLLKEVLE